ncbi:CS1-pili formation C-terminal domain-containing protein [Photobacterium damselae]|uniref:CS1-pili formation C-terminal domain-containing protein n=1 Tax=Photobacterium damselae TaxID=38293 RepID=UPI0030F3A7E3
MKKLFSSMTVLGLVFTMSSSVNAEKFIPKGFNDFFEVKNHNVKFVLPNNVYGNLKVKASYDGLDSIDSEELKKLIFLFEQADIKKEFINNFDKVDLLDSEYIVFNYDKMTAKIQVPAEFMGEQHRKESGFTKIEPDKNAIINELNAFLSGNGGSDFSSTLHHNSIIGIGNGFINIEGDLDSKSSYDLYNISTRYNVNGFEFLVGKGRYISNVSDMSMFDYSVPYDKKTAQISTSNNLQELDQASYKSIYYDMSVKGIVRGYRDDRIIFTKVVKSGTNKISYNNLPKGNYTLKLILEPENGQKEVKEFKIFNNSSSMNLNKNNYALSLNEVNTIDSDKRKYVDISYIRKVDNSDIVLGTTLKKSKDETLVGLGFDGSVIDNLVNLNLYSDINENAIFSNFDIHYNNLTFSWLKQKYFKYDDCSSLFCALYGVDDVEELSFNYSNYIFGNRVSVFYKLTDEFDNTNNRKLKYSSLTLNYNYNIYKNIYADLYYRNRKDLGGESGVDDNIFGVSVNVPLSDSIYSNNIIEISEHNLSTTSSLNYNNNLDSIEGLQINGSIGGTHTTANSEIKQYQNIGLNYNTDKLNSSMYLNNYDGNITSSATLSTNIISDYNNVFFSSEKDESYLIVNTDYNKENEDIDLGTISIKQNNKNQISRDISDDSLVIGLKSFDKYDYSLDIESSGFTSFDGNHLGSVFSYPGSISIIENRMTKVKTFLTFFESFSGEYLDNVECSGDGCTEITEVGDGVYSVSVVENTPFKIIAKGDICLINNDTYKKNRGKSFCFPKIKELDNGMQLVIENDETNFDIYYIGVVEKNLSSEILSLVKNSKIKIIEKDFGTSDKYLFAKIQKGNTLDYEAIEEIKKYANINGNFENTESLVNVYE